MARDLRQAEPVVIGFADDRDPAIIVVLASGGALIGAMRRVIEVTSTKRALFASIDGEIEDHRLGSVDRGFHLAEVDVLTIPGALAVIEGGDQRDGGEVRNQEVGVGDAGTDRFLAGVGGEVRNARCGLQYVTIALPH